MAIARVDGEGDVVRRIGCRAIDGQVLAEDALLVCNPDFTPVVDDQTEVEYIVTIGESDCRCGDASLPGGQGRKLPLDEVVLVGRTTGTGVRSRERELGVRTHRQDSVVDAGDGNEIAPPAVFGFPGGPPHPSNQ